MSENNSFKKQFYVTYHNSNQKFESGKRASDKAGLVTQHFFKGEYETEKFRCDYKLEFRTVNIDAIVKFPVISELLEGYEKGKPVDVELPLGIEGFEYKEDCVAVPEDFLDRLIQMNKLINE